MRPLAPCQTRAVELTVPTGGGQVWADDTGGDGPAVVLLHAGWGDSASWLPLLDRLAPRFRVIRYDTRGYGRSPAPAAPFSQLGDLMSVLDQCGVTEAVLVGHSGGGGTAIGLALASPSRVRALLLLAPGLQDYPWPPEDPYLPGYERLFAAGDHDGMAALGLRTWAAAGADPAVRAQIRAAVAAFFRQGDFERPDPPAFGRLGEIRTPAAVVIGDRDYPMVAACAEEIAARIPGCRRIAAPGADHMLPLRLPGQLADLIDRLDRSAALPPEIAMRPAPGR